MRKVAGVFSAVVIATVMVIFPVSAVSAEPIPCSYGNYFDPAGNQIKAAPVKTVGSQKGKAWCVGYRSYFYVSPWLIVQRDYELATGR